MAKKKQSTNTTQNTTQNTAQNTASNQAFNQQNTYDWQAPPDTADVEAFRGFQPRIDPGLGAQYGAERNRVNNSFINPLGANYSPQVEAKLRNSMNRDLNQQESQAFRQGQYDVNQQKMGQLGTLAALTAPRLLQTGASGTSSGTSSGTGTQTGTMTGNQSTTMGNNLFGDIMSIGSSAANMALG